MRTKEERMDDLFHEPEDAEESETMEKTKHTPGPWIWKTDGFCITIGNESTRHEYLAHDYCVAVIHDNSLQAKANARAIAAVPDLLAALRDSLKLLMNMDEDAPYSNNNRGRKMAAITKLAAAIAKTEGDNP
jgi:hypothetical protein